MSIKIDHAEQVSHGAGGTRVKIDYEVCDNTGVCVMVCPETVLAQEDGGRSYVVRMEACTSCWVCVENCVSGAIDLD